MMLLSAAILHTNYFRCHSVRVIDQYDTGSRIQNLILSHCRHIGTPGPVFFAGA